MPTDTFWNLFGFALVLALPIFGLSLIGFAAALVEKFKAERNKP